MEPEGSLPLSQQPVTYAYPDPHQSMPSSPLPPSNVLLHVSYLRCLFPLLMLHQRISSGSRQFWKFCIKASFYDKELLAPRPTPKQEDYPLSTFIDCLFNIFADTLHIGGHSFIPNLMMRRAVVPRTLQTAPVHRRTVATVPYRAYQYGAFAFVSNIRETETC